MNAETCCTNKTRVYTMNKAFSIYTQILYSLYILYILIIITLTARPERIDCVRMLKYSNSI